MSNIKKLENPKTESYKEIKKIILSDSFPWFFNIYSDSEDERRRGGSKYEAVSFYGHSMLWRPEVEGEDRYSRVSSPYFQLSMKVLTEILEYNQIFPNSFLRINVNQVHPRNISKFTPPHLDHKTIPHNNIIVYLTNTGGETVHIDKNEVIETYSPKEDGAISFSGYHCHGTPEKDVRVVLVGTYI